MTPTWPGKSTGCQHPETVMEDPPSSNRGPLVALLAVVVLVICGWWLMRHIRADTAIQDCVMSGRTNCAPITPPR
jgi:hypothetical protein